MAVKFSRSGLKRFRVVADFNIVAANEDEADSVAMSLDDALNGVNLPRFVEFAGTGGATEIKKKRRSSR